jgi:hypothetical protein
VQPAGRKKKPCVFLSEARLFDFRVGSCKSRRFQIRWKHRAAARERSADDGKTWTVSNDFEYARKKQKTSRKISGGKKRRKPFGALFI